MSLLLFVVAFLGFYLFLFFMCGYDEDRPMRVKDLARLAEQRLASLREEGHEDLNPVKNGSRSLASQVWGAAWMRQLAYCEQEGMQLSTGRSLLRHGCVLDVKLSEGRVSALVSGEELYEVELHVELLDEERLARLRELCHGRLDSLVSLLEGKVDAAVMEALCDPEEGLLPLAEDWDFSCTCPDWASPCAHAAAAVYAAGCLIDTDASLLFALRGIEAQDLLEMPSQGLAEVDFDKEKLGATFGMDFDLD